MANVTGWFAEVSAELTVPRMSATAVMNSPAISVNSAINVNSPRMSAVGVLKTPALGLSTILTIPRMAATAAIAVPVVSNAFNVSVSAPRLTAAGVLKVPAVTVSADIAPPRMAATGAMAVPVVTNNSGANYNDTFNRSDSASLGASWTTDATYASSLAISSNAAVIGGLASNFYALPMATGNNEVTVLMKGAGASGDIVVISARVDSGTDTNSATKSITAALVQGQPWAITRNLSDSGVFTAGNQSWADGDTIVFSCVGATLTIKKNGSIILTTGGGTDLAAGYIGLLVYSSSGTSYGFDSFTAQDI